MFKGFYNLTSGMLTQGKNLDVIANNMSNAATAGFKTDRFTFSTFEEVMWNRVGNMDKKYTELGNQSWITAPSKLYTDYEQGSIEETGQPLDFAIEGDGFFALENRDGERVYTRNGNFSLDNEGYLWLSGYGRVLDRNGETIRLVTDHITGDSTGNLFTENDAYLGTIGVFRFEDNGELEKNDGFQNAQRLGRALQHRSGAADDRHDHRRACVSERGGDHQDLRRSHDQGDHRCGPSVSGGGS